MSSARKTGLRLLELETGLAENVDPSSPELVDYETSRTAGQAARFAMLIRGQDVIDDERRLRKIVAAELKIQGAGYDAVKRYLLDADLIEEKTTRAGKAVLFEKVERLDYGNNYKRIGDVWLAKKERTEKESALIETLDAVVKSPRPIAELTELTALDQVDRDAVIEVATNAAVLDVLEPNRGDRVFYSPLLWDVSPAKLEKFLATCDLSQFGTLVGTVRAKPGSDLTTNADPLTLQAIRGGILPSYRVSSMGGDRLYGFAPYSGGLLTTDEEKTILDKARALVSCLRYGSEAATITRIKYPLAILNALTSPGRGYRLKPHSELKGQYGMLVKKGLGRVVETPEGRYSFELIPTKDNLRACAIASELLNIGEVLQAKDPASEHGALHLVSGAITHPLCEVRVAKKKRGARADELAGLVEQLQSVR